MGWHIDGGIGARIDSDGADIQWYGGCVGAGCGRADIAGGPMWATGRVKAFQGLTGWYMDIERGQYAWASIQDRLEFMWRVL